MLLLRRECGVARNLHALLKPIAAREQVMKPQRAFGVVTFTVLAACAAAWLTPQQQLLPHTGLPADEFTAPVVFSVR